MYMYISFFKDKTVYECVIVFSFFRALSQTCIFFKIKLFMNAF